MTGIRFEYLASVLGRDETDIHVDLPLKAYVALVYLFDKRNDKMLQGTYEEFLEQPPDDLLERAVEVLSSFGGDEPDPTSGDSEERSPSSATSSAA